MFTGIVENLGIVKAESFEDECKNLSIYSELAYEDLKIGDSLAVNGVCLTIIRSHENCFDFSVVPETLALTTLGQLALGSKVNLERAMKNSTRIGGHYVQGHVDGVGEIIGIQTVGAALEVGIAVPPALAKYIVNKGFITIDGMSITVIQANSEYFTVTFIPHTQAVTLVSSYILGTKLNIEVDILGKYVEKIVGGAVS